MIITIASGKGGTGKTTVAVNLAAAISRENQTGASRIVWLADCDVEAPNAGLFLSPEIQNTWPVKRMIPEIDLGKCDLCGRCVEICTSNAFAIAGGGPLLFRELCHACGSCAAQCHTGAITESPEEIGIIRSGKAGSLNFIEGILTVGFSSPTPIIRDLKKTFAEEGTANTVIIRDASPGASCPVVECARGSDFALLVTEPTPFGLHDLALIIELMADDLRLACGVVINKSDGEDKIISDFCAEKKLPILMRIPLSRKIAEAYSRGQLLIDAQPDYQRQFQDTLLKIENLLAENRMAL